MCSMFPVEFVVKYDKSENIYYLWHNGDENLISGESFTNQVAYQMNKHLWNHGIYNIGLGYDPEKVSNNC